MSPLPSPFRTRAAALTIALVALASLAHATPTHAADGVTIDGRFARSGFVTGGSTYAIDIAGRGGVAPDATAVSLNLTITQPAGHGFATVFPCDTARPNASSINFEPGQTIANALVSNLSASGSTCIYAHVTAHIVVDVDGYFRGDGYRPLRPARLLDTRSNYATVDGQHAGSGRRAADSVLELDVAGRGGVSRDATAVALNVTVTETSGPGYVTVFPCGEAQPQASTINFAAGDTIANSVIAKVGSSGRICIATHAAAHLVVDVSGELDRRDFRPLQPARLLDTRRNHPTVDGRDAGAGRRPAGSVYELDVTGRGGSGTDAAAVSLNVTVTDTAGYGYLTVYPCGAARPAASTINFGPGDTIANAIIAKVGTGGRVCLYTDTPSHLVVDVGGSFPVGASDFRPLTPARLADTRPERPPTPTELAVGPSLARLNALRAAYGVGPVTLDPAMSAVALNWSAEMSRTGFRHSGLPYAENIAWNSQSSLSPRDAAAQLHQLWVDSPPHFAAMIDPRYTRVGIGLHLAESGWWGTHLFAP